MKIYQNFNYGDTTITFMNEKDNIFVNGTQIAKMGKRVADWKRKCSTTDYIQKVADARNKKPSDFIRVITTGMCQGTWLHEDIAHLFARSLSVDFYIWCNAQFREVFVNGLKIHKILMEELSEDTDSLMILFPLLKKEKNKVA